MAITAKSGNTIPVILNPINADTHSDPETFPMDGGNIKLPAPKILQIMQIPLSDYVELICSFLFSSFLLSPLKTLTKNEILSI